MARKPLKIAGFFHPVYRDIKQYKPSIELVMSMSDNEGFCIACGETQEGVEPDGRKYDCQSCGKPRVYAREQLIIRAYHY